MLGYHPLLATRADTGEVLHARLRKGSSQRGTKRFVEELIARVRRAGATGELTVRADAGFWSYALIDTLTRPTCIDTCIKAGKTKKEAFRSLKRYIAEMSTTTSPREAGKLGLSLRELYGAVNCCCTAPSV